MNKFEITENTKGKLVYVVDKWDEDYKWLILISSVTKKGNYNYVSYYISYSIKQNKWYFNGGIPSGWGSVGFWNFFEPTDDQKRLVVNKLTSLGYKYIPILNKIVKKKYE